MKLIIGKAQYLFLLALLFSTYSYSQAFETGKDFEVSPISNGGGIIKLNFNNIYNALTMTTNRFRVLMAKYKYNFDTYNNANMYEDSNPNLLAGTYLINKYPGEIHMIWVQDKDMTYPSQLEDQLQNHFRGNLENYAVYLIPDPEDNNYYIKILLDVHEGTHGSLIATRIVKNQ